MESSAPVVQRPLSSTRFRPAVHARAAFSGGVLRTTDESTKTAPPLHLLVAVRAHLRHKRLETLGMRPGASSMLQFSVLGHVTPTLRTGLYIAPS